MSNSFDDMPFFDEEPTAPRRATNNAGAESGGGLGIAARAMAARDQTRAAPDYLSGLNPEQRDAVETLDGPVLVLAGAGTGKTRVLTTRIAHILATGRAYPSQILAVTFTNKAAREMKERIGVLVGGAVEGMPWLGTFHSIGVKLLRRHAELVGLKSDFTILDTDDVVRLIKQLIQAEGLDDKRWPAKQFAGMIDGWKNKGLTPPDIPEGDSRAFANGKGRELYTAYQNRLKTLNACDFGDLLMHPISIFRRNTDILKEYHQKFRYILVDEYQDTNTAQYMWLRLLAQRAKGEPQNVCCVGDDDQSIYGWRGAEVDNILRFDKDFPGAKVIKLERNYRSTEHILGAAGHLIAHNEGRLGKTLFTERSSPDDEKVVVHAAWDSEEEARAVGEEIEQLQRKNHKLNDMAILVRASFQMREFEDRFVTLGLNYRVIGGPRFYERLEIRDAMAYFRLVCQPADDLAFERIVNTPKRGLGDTTIRNLHDYARARDIPMLAAAADIIETDELKPKARKALFDVVQDFRRWQGLLENTEHTTLAEQILDESGYTAMWQADKTAEAPGRLENLKELIRSMEAFESMRGFLEHVALVMDAEQNENLDAVSIMTLHSAKGLEFDTVFLPGWEEGLFPHQRALDEGGRSGLEEERRLAYVGITRAKKLCHIWFVSNRRIHGLWQSTLPSRFLDELPPAHVDVAASDSNYGGYGGRGGYGQSRFDKADPFTNNYSTPGWKRAQQNRSDATRDNWGTRSGHAVERIGYGESGPRTRTIDGELVAKSVADKPSKFFVGDRVFHIKFGNGNISAIEGNKLTIDFDRAGQKRVLDGFVEKV
ncbi:MULTISPECIES: ATP-dependent helicase [Agrobacterium]|uniref:DNA 3'-5' helicase n=1 Tax=Agrobacterium salinitolerans TaxID=1183413 RepID=A0ABY3BVF7_9HYPH|nr:MULTISPECIES: UvrD-helicase domain-containing protein [Agrobacterium]MCZ7857017.1 UvrD-helicase domain-containing protein [Agrobacterium salinitolerans]MCZ7885895.1 UvrD-helicase domain-containing protein [Agrobacterium salinitolerans]MCZ7890358.1 UvrD-helicase domain-containing protein [Agrobacterium salinitolerans]MDA5627913.1 UvrD-helicase domain-containing protein [Agrobacterium sp. ST15.16.055]MDA5637183.1 UvrD-helicase domain-containing protein [Agrobacterium sp. ST15.13.013]